MTNRPVEPTAGGGVAAWAREVRRRSAQVGEPSWLLAMRLDALARFERRDPDEYDLVGLSPVSAMSAGAASGPAPGIVDLPPELSDLGVIVEPLDVAVRLHPELVRTHLGTVAGAAHGAEHDPGGDEGDPGGDEGIVEGIAALNGAMWSGGTFIHVPAGVVITVPIQATSRGRVAALGRFDRTLLVAGEGSAVHYIEGCSAPIYAADPLRSSVTEIVVGAGARVTHTAIQNWSTNVVNLAVKDASVATDGHLEWIDGNMGSGRTSTCPTSRLVGPGASATVRSVTMAEAGQHQEVGARMVHAAPATSSVVEARIIADGGVCTHRGRVDVVAAATGASASFAVDGLLLAPRSSSGIGLDTDPDGDNDTGLDIDSDSGIGVGLDRRVEAEDATVEERRSTAPLHDGQLHYLSSRGLPTTQAEALLANGFIEPVTRRLPVEFAVEWNRLIELQRTGSVG